MSLHYEKARLLVEQSRYQMAERELQQALAEFPNDVDACNLLAYCLSQLQRHEEAIAQAKEAIAIAPEYPYAYQTLAQVLVANNQYDEAKSAIEEAIRLDCQLVRSFIILSHLLCLQGNWSEALVAAEQGLTLDAENIACLNNCSCALSGLNRVEEAIATLKKVISLDPAYALAYYNLGLFLLDSGADPDESLQYLQESLRLDPTYPLAQKHLLRALKAKTPIYKLLKNYQHYTKGLFQWPAFISILIISFLLSLYLAEFFSTDVLSLLVLILVGIFFSLAHLELLIQFLLRQQFLFDFFISFDPLGQSLLFQQPNKIFDVRLTFVCLTFYAIATFISLLLLFITANEIASFTTVIFGGLWLATALLLPLEKGRFRKTRMIYLIILSVIGIVMLALSWLGISLPLSQLLSYFFEAIAGALLLWAYSAIAAKNKKNS
jgi:Flp pilus assembly protein TadD